MSPTPTRWRHAPRSARAARRPLAAVLGALAVLAAPLSLANPVSLGGVSRSSMPGLYYTEWIEAHDRSAEAEPSEYKLISYFFVRGSATNQLGDPAGLKGVTLGPIGIGSAGSGTATGKETDNYYIEQRWIPVFSYSPHFVDRLATFNAQFEIDFTYGFAANSVQQNVGGGFNSDQINLQTKNLNVALSPTKRPDKLSLIVGTHAAYDSIYDPTRTSLFDLVQTGYKLTFLGTDATGLSLFSNYFGRQKVSFIPLGVSQPDKAALDDPRFSYAFLTTLDYAYELLPGTVLGATYWYLRDDTKGEAYAMQGLVKAGPASTGLGSFTGTQRFNLAAPVGDVHYAGAHFHHNIGFRTGDFGASGFVMYNGGRYIATTDKTETLPKVDISGVAADLELKYNIGRSLGDVVSLEGIMTTGDSNPDDERYSSAFTMNYYGLPGATWFNHKTLILFPFTSTVSNYTGAVVDISNGGYGVLGAIGAVAYDVIPNKLNLKSGAAFAQAWAPPLPREDGSRPGRVIGSELNFEARYHIRYLMTVGLHAAYMFRGDFYRGNPDVARDPWALFSTFTWYAF